MRKGLLILISGPSGTGKGTVCDLLRQKHPEISYSISATTRQPRPGEQDGVNYYFYTKEKFREMIDQGQLLEWAEVYGNFYGTPKQKVLDRLEAGEDILLESTRKLDEVCCRKGIHTRFEYWGKDVNHDWPWWHKMVVTYLPWLLG